MQNGLPAVCGAPSYTAFDVIAVAASLGGPAALARLVAAIPSSFPRVLIAAASIALVMVPA